jgi:hypothetical protein
MTSALPLFETLHFGGDCSAVIAHEVARERVLFLRRSGGQKQLSASLSPQAAEMKSIGSPGPDHGQPAQETAGASSCGSRRHERPHF